MNNFISKFEQKNLSFFSVFDLIKKIRAKKTWEIYPFDKCLHCYIAPGVLISFHAFLITLQHSSTSLMDFELIVVK